MFILCSEVRFSSSTRSVYPEGAFLRRDHDHQDIFILNYVANNSKPKALKKSRNRSSEEKRTYSLNTYLFVIIIFIIIIIIIIMATPAPLQLPAEFVCPVTKQLMKEPVLSRYGHHFERSAIHQHIESGNPFCPVTGNPLRTSDLISNKTLQWKIKNWADKNGHETAAATKDAADKTSRSIKTVGCVAVPVPPARFHCPLTRNIMKDPVMTMDGINFERDAIVKWLHSTPEGTCPVTAKPLSCHSLVTNSMLQREIEEWEQRYGNVQSTNEEKNNLGEVASMGSSSYSLKLTSGSELFPRNMIRSLPTDLYSKNSNANTRIKYLRRNRKSLVDALDSAIKYSEA
jgi:hypothetical protein